MGTLTIERVGGLAGIGHVGSAVRSRAQVTMERLSPEDRAVIEELFVRYRDSKKSDRDSPLRDLFRYRLSRGAEEGAESIEVAEELVPRALVRLIKDELV